MPARRPPRAPRPRRPPEPGERLRLGVVVGGLAIATLWLYGGAMSVAIGLLGDGYSDLLGSSGPLGEMNLAIGEVYEAWSTFNLLTGAASLAVGALLALASVLVYRARPAAPRLLFVASVATLVESAATLRPALELYGAIAVVTEEHTTRAIAALPEDGVATGFMTTTLEMSRASASGTVAYAYGFTVLLVAYLAFAAYAYTRPGVFRPAPRPDPVS